MIMKCIQTLDLVAHSVTYNMLVVLFHYDYTQTQTINNNEQIYLFKADVLQKFIMCEMYIHHFYFLATFFASISYVLYSFLECYHKNVVFFARNDVIN